MPIRSLDTWATSHNKSQTLPLSVLKDTTIGIEADHYLLRLLTTSPSKEPLVTALGGFPFGLRYAVEGDIEDFQKAGIKPIFVFSGLKIVRNEKPFSVNDDGPAKRSQAWDLYDQGLASEAVEAFGAAATRGLQIFHKDSTRVRSRLSGCSLLSMASGTISGSHSNSTLHVF